MSWKYVLTGTDKVGNIATTTTTVKVDLVPTAGGSLTVNGLAASTAGTTSGNTNAATFPIDSRTDFTDAELGLKTSTLTRAAATFTAGACGTFGTATTLVGTPLQSALATSCYKYVLTGTDNALNGTIISTIVQYDVTPPTAGALTVNAVAASAVGTSSTTNAASFTIGTRKANTDVASDLASSTLTRRFAALTGSTCSSFGSTTVIVGNPAQTALATGCYMYTQPAATCTPSPESTTPATAPPWPPPSSWGLCHGRVPDQRHRNRRPRRPRRPDRRHHFRPD